jgi:hypothetical protein
MKHSSLYSLLILKILVKRYVKNQLLLVQNKSKIKKKYRHFPYSYYQIKMKILINKNTLIIFKEVLHNFKLKAIKKENYIKLKL